MMRFDQHAVLELLISVKLSQTGQLAGFTCQASAGIVMVAKKT